MLFASLFFLAHNLANITDITGNTDKSYFRKIMVKFLSVRSPSVILFHFVIRWSVSLHLVVWEKLCMQHFGSFVKPNPASDHNVNQKSGDRFSDCRLQIAGVSGHRLLSC